MLLVQENVGVLGNDFQIVKRENATYIEGIFVKSDIPNGNNRVYPKKYLQNGINLYNRDFINTKKSIGELDHPIPPRTDALLTERALRVEKLEMQDNGEVIGKALVLKGATKGKELLEIIEEETAFGTSFRALTQLKNGTDGFVYAGPDIFFRAFDAVLIPSVGEDVSSVSESINHLENVWEHSVLHGVLTQAKSLNTNTQWAYKNGELVVDMSPIDLDVFISSFQ